MDEQYEPDLAGIYITDDYIDVLLGADRFPNWEKHSLSTLDLIVHERDIEPFRFSNYDNYEDAFHDVGNWITQRAPNLRSVGVACYGPFHTIARKDRGTPLYGKLWDTSHGRLSEVSLPTLILSGLSDLKKRPELTVETDVAAAAIGYVHDRTQYRSGQSSDLQDQVVVFIKASLGVGGAFLRASTPWHGRLNSEMGQFQVPRWPDPTGVEANWAQRVVNPNSIEGLASVGAIEARYGAKFEALSAHPDHEAWDREAWYLAQLAWTIHCVVSPHEIVFGGRIIGVPGLIDRVREVFEREVASIPYHEGLDDLESYLVPSLTAGTKGQPRVEKPGAIGTLCIAAMEAKAKSV